MNNCLQHCDVMCCDVLYAAKLPPQHQHETWFWTNQGWVEWWPPGFVAQKGDSRYLIAYLYFQNDYWIKMCIALFSFLWSQLVKKHRKKNHPSQVTACEKYLNGTCIRSDVFCWYKHEGNVRNQPQSGKNLPQNFPSSQPQALPPECLVQMMEALEGLGSKVENFKLSIKNFIQ